MMRTSGISSCGDDPDSGISAISPANDSVSMDGLAGFTSPKIPLSFDARRVFLVGVAQLVRAPDCGSGGRRFDSGRSPLFLLPRHSRWLANFCDTTLGIGGASAPPEESPVHSVDTPQNPVYRSVLAASCGFTAARCVLLARALCSPSFRPLSRRAQAV